MQRPVIERVRGCTLLPSLPSVALRLMELVRRDAPVAEIAKVISADPAITSRLLRTVNSSFYRRSHTVSTVAHAVDDLSLDVQQPITCSAPLATRSTSCAGSTTAASICT